MGSVRAREGGAFGVRVVICRRVRFVCGERVCTVLCCLTRGSVGGAGVDAVRHLSTEREKQGRGKCGGSEGGEGGGG